MKGDNYPNMRKLLSNFLGSPVLRMIKDNQEALDMDPEVFDLVYEGFWDLYTIKDNACEISARKLQAWIAKIKLQSGPDRSPPSSGEAAEEEKAAAEEGAESANEAPAEKTNIDLDAQDTFD